MTTWRKGPPPSIGWWPASMSRDLDILRWWDGSAWSQPAFCEESAEIAAMSAEEKSPVQKFIRWTDRPAWWPARSKT